jgi:hypothetical protein
MNPEFVPFAAGAGDGSRPRSEMLTEVVAAGGAAKAFRPLMAAPAPTRGEGTEPRPGAAAAVGDAHPPGHGTAGKEPRIVFEREGERVVRIRIECPCGNVIELACDYSGGPVA